MNQLTNRRPLKSRGSGWAAALARILAQGKVAPDLISFTSIAFAVLGAACLCLSGISFAWMRGLLLVLAGVAIQLRLLCNLLDGMVAVEHGRGGPYGPIWNELPDRVADLVLLAGAGYAAYPGGQELGVALGWLCAALALIAAYVRELGRALGQPADFSGPMAKPHRMALLTAACALSLLEPLWDGRGQTMLGALGLMAALTLLTVVGRTRRLAQGLKASRADP